MWHDEYTEEEKVAKLQKSLLFSCTDSCTNEKKTVFLAVPNTDAILGSLCPGRGRAF